ncbi:MAG: hypothetical protein FWE26_04555 [Coriobacteriia bacterium]|nr:hypothetical protein [Coriobacteriia bacterium]
MLFALCIVAAALFLLFSFLFSQPFELARINESPGEGITFRHIQQEEDINIASPEIIAREFGSRLDSAHLETHLGLRSSVVNGNFRAVTDSEFNAFIQHMAQYEGFWLIRARSDPGHQRAMLVKVVEDIGILTFTIRQDVDANETTFNLTAIDFGLFGTFLYRASALDGFLEDYGLSAGTILMQHGGLYFEAMGDYLQLAADIFEGMDSEEASEFGQSLREFLWSLFVASLSIVSPFIIISIVKLGFYAKRKKDELDEAVPAVCERYSNAKDKFTAGKPTKEKQQNKEESEQGSQSNDYD